MRPAGRSTHMNTHTALAQTNAAHTRAYPTLTNIPLSAVCAGTVATVFVYAASCLEIWSVHRLHLASKLGTSDWEGESEKCAAVMKQESKTRVIACPDSLKTAVPVLPLRHSNAAVKLKPVAGARAVEPAADAGSLHWTNINTLIETE